MIGSQAEVRLSLPTFVLDQMSDANISQSLVSVEADDDLGWMYKIFDKIELSSLNGTESPHFIWPSDSF